MRYNVFHLLFLCSAFSLSSQAVISWDRLYGGSSTEYPYDIKQTSDYGYVLACTTSSTDGDITESYGDEDIWILKLDSVGQIEWQKSLGGSKSDRATSINQTNDGGFIVAGRTFSNNGLVTGNHGSSDFWVVKLDSKGGLEWQRTYGGSKAEQAGTIGQTSDGGYIAISTTESKDGDVSFNHGYYDVWVLKLSEFGEIQWEKTFGGTDSEVLYMPDIQETTDYGYILASTTYSLDGDVTRNHGEYDAWIIKLSITGEIIWQKSYGGKSAEVHNDIYITQINEGGYIISTTTKSIDGNVSGNNGNRDLWMIKINEQGEIEWENTLGGSGDDYQGPVISTPDGGYAVAGVTFSDDFDVSGNHGKSDIWLVKLSQTGELEWQRALGGSQLDSKGGITLAHGGGFLITGSARSSNGDVSGIPIQSGVWVIKLSPEMVQITEPRPFETLNLYPNPATSHVFLKTPPEGGAMSVKITDANGRLVLQQTLPNGVALDVSALPNGIYSLMATAPSGKIFSNKLNISR